MLPVKKDKYSSLKKMIYADAYSDIRKGLKSIGIFPEKENQCSSYIQVDNDIYLDSPDLDGLEIFPVTEVINEGCMDIEKYFSGIPSAAAENYINGIDYANLTGYYIRVSKGVRITRPVRTVFILNSDAVSMNILNIVIVEDEASLNLVTGCTSGQCVSLGQHSPLTEYYVGRNAELVNTMIHNWGSRVRVEPGSRTVVEDNGRYTENYYCLRPSDNVKIDPFIYLSGFNSTAKLTAATVSMPETLCEINGTILMTGENSGAEICSRTVNTGGTAIQKGIIDASGKNARGHVDCSGLLMDETGTIEAVPGLISRHPDVKLSHEAAIGRIDSGEVSYLQSKGLTESDATSLIVRGFLDIKDNEIIAGTGFEELISEIVNTSGH